MDMFQWEQDGYYFRVRIKPGVAQTGQAVEVVLDIARLLTTPHPRYGDRKPVVSAALDATIYLADGGAKAPAPVGRRLVAMADKGAYGLHVTLSRKGVYGVAVQGKVAEFTQPIDIRFPLPVDVWPVPPALKEKVPAPAKLATVFDKADLIYGRTLCKDQCRKDVAWARPANALPTYLQSPSALALSNAELLETFIEAGALRTMSELDKADLIFYLRSLHYPVERFFPEGARFTVKQYTIDEHGQNRLKESLKKAAAAELGAMYVVTIYKPAEGQAPETMPLLVSQVPRLLDGLKPQDKEGYLVFTTWPGKSKVAELALAMDTYFSIKGIAVRDVTGAPIAKLERDLRGFVGQGRFNDPRSLRKGPRALLGGFLPVYLAAAEAATMFVREENDRFSFDSALGD